MLHAVVDTGFLSGGFSKINNVCKKVLQATLVGVVVVGAIGGAIGVVVVGAITNCIHSPR